MKIITKTMKILSNQNCLFYVNNLLMIIFVIVVLRVYYNNYNFQKQQIELNSRFDYFYLLKYFSEVRFLLQRFKFNKDLLAG